MITEFEFAALSSWSHLLWALLALLLVCAWGVARRRHALDRFGVDSDKYRAWISACGQRRWLRVTTLCVAGFLMIAAAVQPRCNPQKREFQREARDIAIVLDVSKSMLAEDMKPNRLEKAKEQLQRLCDHLDGDRIGLVVFAGDAVIKSYLSSQYSYFKSVLRSVDHTSASQGGTRIGDALRKTVSDLLGYKSNVARDDTGKPKVGETVVESELVDEEQRPPADILLITDGEDHDSYPLRAAEEVGAAGVGLYVIGLGSEEGSPIPITGTDGVRRVVRYNDEVVLSKLDVDTLEQMLLKAPRGSLTKARTNHFDLVEIYKGTIAKERGKAVVEESLSWTEIYQPFLLGGILFYLIFFLIPERPGRQRPADLTEVAMS